MSNQGGIQMQDHSQKRPDPQTPNLEKVNSYKQSNLMYNY